MAAPNITNERELLIEALRTINRMSEALRDASNAALSLVESGRLPKDSGKDALTDRLFAALGRRFRDASGLLVFIAAEKMIELPEDLRGDDPSDVNDE